MIVKDFMITDVISVHPELTVKQLLALFVRHRIGGVPVVDQNNKLLSMVSDGDVLRFLTPKDKTVHDLFFMAYVAEEETIDEVLDCKLLKTVAEVTRHKEHPKNIVSLSPDDKFEHAIRLLAKHHFKKLPVIDETKQIVGVISRGDIIYNLSKKIIS